MVNYLRKLVCGLLVASLLASLAPASLAKSSAFTDVPEEAWFAGAVDYVAENGLFFGEGDGKFNPHGPMNRAMMVQVLANATENYLEKDFSVAGSPAFEPLPYTDVNETQTWYGPPIRWATMYGIASGKGNGIFGPFTPVTREEAAVLLYRYAENTENDVQHAGTSVEKFTDSASVSSWAVEAVDWAAQNRILEGYPDGSLQPAKGITRAEASAIFLNAKDVLVKRTAIFPMTETAQGLGITANNYPVVDGSKLMQSLADNLYRVMHGIHDPLGFKHSGTVPSYQNLIDGKVDLLLVPDVTADVLEQAEKAGVALESYEIARDGLVFVTPKENKAADLSIEQVRKIYSDYSIKNWSALGGDNKNLIPFCGKSLLDDRQMQLERLVLRGAPLHKTITDDYCCDSWNTVIFKVQNYHTGYFEDALENSYAMAPLNYSMSISNSSVADTLKTLAVNGISPTEKNIASGDYPLTYSYYAVIRKDLDANHPARKLARWLQSEEGKELVQKSQEIAPIS